MIELIEALNLLFDFYSRKHYNLKIKMYYRFKLSRKKLKNKTKCLKL